MTFQQQVFALIASVGLLIFIVEMVRRRKLREEYSWLWIITGASILVLSLWFDLLQWLTHLVGAVVPVSTLFAFGILFLIVINVYFSIKVSTLTTQVKNLAQRLAIVDHYVQQLRGSGPQVPPACGPAPPVAGPSDADTSHAVGGEPGD
jgi:hypothetical protein